MPLDRRSLLAALASLLLAAPAVAEDQTISVDIDPSAGVWSAVENNARGQTVYWNAWGGDDRINAYIRWAGDRVEQSHGVKVVHVKLDDTAHAVNRVLADKTAGRDSGGSIDLIWINGENFAAMKRNGLLYGPFTQYTPNYAAYVDTTGKPTTLVDFTIPVDGMEAPWGMAQFVFFHDTAVVGEAPDTLDKLQLWAAENPGRFTYPRPPAFIGSTFLKQILVTKLGADNPALSQAPGEGAAEVLQPLWAWLDQLHPNLWRKGTTFPANGPAAQALLADGEIDIAMSFHPAEASAKIADGVFPETVRSFVMQGGTIGNTHFVAIPFNAKARDGAMVLANFLMSPEAQLRKQDPAHWGDYTVLDLDRVPPAQKAGFEALELGPATLGPDQLGTPLAEPHPGWMELIEAEWAKRYGG